MVLSLKSILSLSLAIFNNILTKLIICYKNQTYLYQTSGMLIEKILLPVDKLGQEKDEMFSLFQSHFEGVTYEQFEQDLNSKNWVILLKDNSILKGFTTMLFYEAKFKNESVRIVYSGDTITDPSIWSNPALAQAWVASVKAIHKGRKEKLYWLLISSGFRTYRFLSVFWKTFYPCYNQETPSNVAEFINNLAQEQFKEYFDIQTGIIRLSQPQILRPHLQKIPNEKLKNSHIAFFLQKNPNYNKGDELVCFAEVSETYLTRAGLRIWQNANSLQIPFPVN